ncbi:MAG: 3-phosphoglycerate dehydrogenase [Clostridia bacterium]|nr:3-phosphoglycerate dehydrogenase [Clostridia bacterium]
MYRILTLNKISKTGLAHFDGNLFTCADDFENPDGVIVRSASMHEMELPDNLLAIARAGAGYNNIPVDKCTENGICVFNTPGANANAVKELVLCALFLTSRKIVEGAKWCEGLKGSGSEVSKKVEKGKSQFAGPEILGTTLGVVGLGAIGKKIAVSAKALGMDVIGYDPFLTQATQKELGDDVRLTADLADIFAAADYITLHAPLNDATRGMICEKSLAGAKDGVRILNFARAELADEADLLAALESGKVAAYATDFPTDAEIGTPGVVAIPHLGASTPEAEENCAVMAVEQISDYLKDGNVKNSVNLPALSLPRSAAARISVIAKADVKAAVADVLAAHGAAVAADAAAERKGVNYLLFDTDDQIDDALIDALKAIEGIVSIRIL